MGIGEGWIFYTLTLIPPIVGYTRCVVTIRLDPDSIPLTVTTISQSASSLLPSGVAQVAIGLSSERMS